MGDKRMMTKKEQHEFFLKEIQPYVDKKVKEAKQKEAEEIFKEIELLLNEDDIMEECHLGNEFYKLKKKWTK